MKKKLYTVLQIAYWSSVAILLGYTVSFLQANGLSNGKIGIISAGRDLIGIFGSLYLSKRIDRQRIEIRWVTLSVLTTEILACTILSLLPFTRVISPICCLIAVSCCLMVNPFYIKLVLSINREREEINYSLARGLGSLAFALTAWFVGKIVQEIGLTFAYRLALPLLLIQLIVILFLNGGRSSQQTEARSEMPHNLSGLVKHNPFFGIMLIGIALIYAANNTVGNYMINVVKSVGGNYSDLGKTTLLLAFSEFPAMSLYARFGKTHTVLFLRISFLFFPIKLLAISLASSMSGLCSAMLLQCFAIGLYTPAVVDYIRRTVPEKDSTKAQSLAAMMPSFGTLLVIPVTGFLLDGLHLSNILVLLITLSAIGAAIALIGTWKHTEQKKA